MGDEAPDNDQPPSTRRYMSKSQRACDLCRTRKSACRIDTNLPCRLCRSHKRQCTFDEPSRRRTPRPQVAAAVEATAAGAGPHTVNAASSLDGLNPMPEADYSQWIASMDFDVDIGTFGGFNEADDNQQLDTWMAFDGLRPQTTDGEMNTGVAELSPAGLSELTRVSTNPATIALGDTSTISQICGLSGDMDPYLLQQYRFDPVTHSLTFKRLAVHSVASNLHPVQFLISLQAREERPDFSHDVQRAELEVVVTPEVGQRLVDLYYRFIFPQVPLFSAQSRVDVYTAPSYVLAAIYLVAQAFSSFDDYLCIQTVYEDPPLDKLRKIALNAIYDSVSVPTISHLQSALLLLLAPPEDPVRPDYCGRWALLGVVVSMAQSLGFYHEPGGWNLSDEEISLRRRLSWVIRYADTWLAAALGRSPLISSLNWAVQPPTVWDFGLEEEEQRKGLAFTRLIALTNILTTVLENLYALNAVDTLSSDFRSTLQSAQPRMADLTKWFQATDFTSGEDGASLDVNDNGVVQLGYYAVKFWILRATMRPFHVRKMQTGSSHLVDDAPAVQEAYGHLRLAAEKAVTELTAFTATLDSGRLHAFWPFWCGLAWSSMGQLCTLLLLSAKDAADAKRQKAALDCARRVLRLQSKSLATLKFPLLRLDSMHWKGFDKCFDLSLQVHSALYG